MIHSTQEIADQRDRAQKILAVFKKADADWTDIRTAQNEDLRFYDGDNEDEQDARAARAYGNKVQIKVNFIKQYVQMVDNMRRQKDISLECHATDEQGSKETAEVIEGLFRHIEDISHAKHAYNAAFGPTGALVAGMGFIKVETDYVTKDSFEQEIFIRPVLDPNKILPDFNTKCPVFSDAEYWFEFDDVTKTDYESQFPDSILASFPTWNGMGKKSQGFVGNTTVRLAKYWYKEYESFTVVQYEDGSIGMEGATPPDILKSDEELLDEQSEWVLRRKAFNAERDSSVTDKTEDYIPSDEDIEGDILSDRREASIVKTRQVNNVTVKWCVTNGVEILSEGEWHNEDFPFVPAVGMELFLEGERTIQGITRAARAPQMMVSYLSSELIRKTAATTKSQWVIDVDSVPVKFLKDWMSSNINEKSALFWSSKMAGAQGIGPPQRADMAEPELQGLLSSLNNFNSAIKQTMGLTPQSADALTGKPDNNQSGVALQTLTENGELANFHFSDNSVLTMKRLGEIVINLIPIIYDTPRTVRIIGADGSPSLVKINQIFQDGKKSKVYDLTTGEYGVIINTGPGHSTKTSQNISQMIQLATLDPEVMSLVLPDIAKESDWDTDGTIQDMLTQLRAFKNPWLQPMDKDEDVPPQIKAQIVQLKQAFATAQAHVQALTQAYQTEKQKNDVRQGDNETKIQVENIKQKTTILQKQGDIELEKLTTADNIHQSEVDAGLERTRLRLEAAATQLDHSHRTRQIVMDHVHHVDKMNKTK